MSILSISLISSTIILLIIALLLYWLARMGNDRVSLGAWFDNDDAHSVWSVTQQGKLKKVIWRLVSTLKRWLGREHLVGNGVHASELEYVGNTELPKKIYEGDSCNISVRLRRMSTIPSEEPVETFHVKESESSKTIRLNLHNNNDTEQFLEVEFQAAGLKIDGDRKQRQKLSSENIVFYWNCAFMTSGTHMLNMIFRIVDAENLLELGTISHSFRVVKLDGLTQQQIWALSRVAATMSGAIAIAATFHQLGLW